MAEIGSGASARPPSPPPPPPPAPAAQATPPSSAARSAPSAPSTPRAPAALRDAFQSSPLQQAFRNQGDAFTPSPAPGQRPVAQAPQPRPAAQAGQVADRERADAANKVRQEMLERARTSTARIAGQTPEGLIRRAITENPNITDEQILAMARLRPEQVASSPDAQRRTLEQIPNARSLPSHQLTVDLLHAVTGIDRETLSRNGPDLGITGSADRVWPGTQTPIVFHTPPNDRERLSTSLHDLTDTMRFAGVAGVNQAVWGAEGQVRSAAISLSGVPQNFLDQTTLREGDETVRPRRR